MPSVHRPMTTVVRSWQARAVLALTAFIVGLCAASGAFAITPSDAARGLSSGIEVLTGPQSVIVGFEDGAEGAVSARLHELGARAVRRSKAGVFSVFAVPHGVTPGSFAQRLGHLPGVRYAEPNRPVRLALTAVDPDFGRQWDMVRIGAPAAWDVSRGAGVTVAIVDTGVDLGHPEFAGRIDTVNDYDFVNADASAQDDHGHGTHVAGILAAALNNTNTGVFGVAGVANLCTILPVKVMSSTGDGTTDGLAEGIRWAADKGADVINLSLGTDEDSQALTDAVNYAIARDIVVVAAVGNDGTYGVLHPARLAPVIGVAATTSADDQWRYSNYGPGVDVCAPGVDIYSTYWNQGAAYGLMSGTSMATPHVAGVVALIRGMHPGWTRSQVEEQLLATVRDMGASGPDDRFGYGLARAAEAVGATTPGGTLIGTVATTGGSSLGGATVTVPGCPSVTTDEDGGYVLAGIVAGTYDVWYSKPGYTGSMRRVTVISDAFAQCDVELYPDVSDATPPQLMDLTLDTTTVDVMSGNRTLGVWARITDERTGYSSGFVTLTGPSGGTGVFGILGRTSGTPSDGWYMTTLVLPATAELGVWSLSVTAFDAAGNLMSYGSRDLVSVGLPSSVTVVAGALTGPRVVALEGEDRIATALAVSEAAFPGRAEWVVVATGYDWPDALGGAALAGVLDAPLLLTRPEVLPANLAAEVERLGADHVIVLGGTGAVSASVVRQLEAVVGVGNVERIGGADRYATAAAIADRVAAERGADFDGGAFVATGGRFPDALAAGPLATVKGWPLLLVRPCGGDEAELTGVLEGLGVHHTIVLGGEGSVATSVAEELARLGSVVRLAGADRYETALAVAAWAVDDGALSYDRCAVATGEDFPDALVGGVLQGRSGSVLLITPTASLDARVERVLLSNRAGIDEVRFLGGAGAIAPVTRQRVLDALR